MISSFSCSTKTSCDFTSFVLYQIDLTLQRVHQWIVYIDSDEDSHMSMNRNEHPYLR